MICSHFCAKCNEKVSHYDEKCQKPPVISNEPHPDCANNDPEFKVIRIIRRLDNSVWKLILSNGTEEAIIYKNETGIHYQVTWPQTRKFTIAELENLRDRARKGQLSGE